MSAPSTRNKPAPRKLRSKIKTAQALKRVMTALRKGAPRKGAKSSKSRLKFVFTNGCFDILHPGHALYLEKAREQGDYLVVALNSDESVRRIKGPERPINTLADRLEVMAALECVDFVTWFEEEDPLAVILQLRPDVLVKGGDWKIEQMIGGKEVLSWGGKVKSLTYIEGKSTTDIIERSRRKLSAASCE